MEGGMSSLVPLVSFVFSIFFVKPTTLDDWFRSSPLGLFGLGAFFSALDVCLVRPLLKDGSELFFCPLVPSGLAPGGWAYILTRWRGVHCPFFVFLSLLWLGEGKLWSPRESD